MRTAIFISATALTLGTASAQDYAAKPTTTTITTPIYSVTTPMHSETPGYPAKSSHMPVYSGKPEHSSVPVYPAKPEHSSAPVYPAKPEEHSSMPIYSAKPTIHSPVHPIHSEHSTPIYSAKPTIHSPIYPIHSPAPIYPTVQHNTTLTIHPGCPTTLPSNGTVTRSPIPVPSCAGGETIHVSGYGNITMSGTNPATIVVPTGKPGMGEKPTVVVVPTGKPSVTMHDGQGKPTVVVVPSGLPSITVPAGQTPATAAIVIPSPGAGQGQGQGQGSMTLAVDGQGKPTAVVVSTPGAGQGGGKPTTTTPGMPVFTGAAAVNGLGNVMGVLALVGGVVGFLG